MPIARAIQPTAYLLDAETGRQQLQPDWSAPTGRRHSHSQAGVRAQARPLTDHCWLACASCSLAYLGPMSQSARESCRQIDGNGYGYGYGDVDEKEIR